MDRKILKQVVVCFAALGVATGISQAGDKLMTEYHQPARVWAKESLPVGNGFLGGMIFGGVDCERIQFNEDTLWTGDDKNRGDYQPFGDVFIFLTDDPILVPQYAAKPHSFFRDNQVDSIDNNPETVWSEKFNNEIEGDFLVWEAKYPVKIALSSYSITSPSSKHFSMPTAWEFQGSSDGENWITLDAQKGTNIWTVAAQKKTFTFENKEACGRYRFLFKATRKLTPEQKKESWVRPEMFEVAEISLGSSSPSSETEYTNYRRSLNIEDAVSFVSYEANGVKYKREYFCSNPAGVLVMRLTADKPGQYTGTLVLKDAHGTVSTAEGQRISFKGFLENDLAYEAQLHVINDGGKLSVSGNELSFEGADGLTLFLSAGTDYVPDLNKGWRGEPPHRKVTERVDKAAHRSYGDLRAEHIQDYKSVFDRVKFDIAGAKRGDMPFDQRLAAYTEGAEDLYLERFLFHMGRYLLISSSRPGSLPANLQGIWNNRLSPLWGSDYHSNINIQMSHWPALTANMPEIHMQYIDYISSQIPSYRIRLKEAVAAGQKNRSGQPRWKTLPRGWTMRSNGGLFGGTGFAWCESANAWHMQHFWEQYAFTQDKKYLREIAYPAMKEVCQYWEDRLKQRADGTLVVPDGWSPEHGDEEDGVTFDQMLVWDLFNNFVEASDELDVDKEYRDKIAGMRDRLLAPKVGRWGQLQEWEADKDDPEEMHRHFAHLVGLHPGRQISPITTPELAAATAVTLKVKNEAMVKVGLTSWKMTGWDKAWRMCLWARLERGEEAHEMLREMISTRVYPTLMSLCWPFEICLDANSGYTAGVCEMLLQSHVRVVSVKSQEATDGLAPYELHVLPALPEQWATGSVKGLTARGAFEVDIDWADMKAKEVQIKSNAGKLCRVRTNEEMENISGVDAEKVKRIESNVIEFPTESGKVYVLRP